MMIDTEKLDIELKELEAKFKKYDRPSLTYEIKVLFSGLFKDDADCYRYANGIHDSHYELIDGDTEFVYDLVVVKEERNITEIVKEDFIIDTLLVLETELDDSLPSVVVDFQKLLLSNADEKVMVFKCKSTEFERWTNFLKTCIEKYRKANGRFHLIARLNDTYEFKREAITI